MHKRHLFVFISVLCVLALLACGLFACNKVKTKSDPAAGRVVAVGTAMNTVYGAMVASDGSKKANKFTLLFDGSYTAGETIYDFSFGGAFDVTQNNRENDLYSQMYFEVKQGEVEVFLLYYGDGFLYLDFPPYASRAKISDFNLAEVVYAVFEQKENGVVKTVADDLPKLASRIFDGCRYYSEEGTDRYRFTLSYKSLFDAFSSFVASWDAGFTPGELLSALHLDEDSVAALSEGDNVTYLDFVVKDGAFLSAKAVSEGKGSIVLDSFSLTSGAADIKLPDALSSFTEFDFRNFSLSGTLYLKTESASSDKSLRYGLSLSRDFETASYPFDYEFTSHYVAGIGLEFDLILTDLTGVKDVTDKNDKNRKTSRFAVRGEYLFVDLSAYGVQKFKMKTADLWEKLGVTGFCDVEQYTFKDEMHLIALLLGARSQEGDLVTYELGSDFFDLLSKKIGFAGLFGVSGMTLGWNKANARLQDLRASLSIGAASLSLQASSFVFGTPVGFKTALDQTQYVDLAARESTRLSAKGTLTAHTAFSTDGDFLSAFLSSLAGEELTFEAKGNVAYTADVVYGPTGALRRVLVRLYAANGDEIVTVYYTEESASSFYLVYPESSGVRTVRAFSIAEGLLSAFNEALGASDSSVSNKILLAFKEKSFTIGAYSPMVTYLEEKLALLYPDLSFDLFKSLLFRRFELKVSKDSSTGKILLTGKTVFDSDNDLTVTATEFALTFGEDVGVTEIAVDAPEKVSLFANNDMPTTARVTFAGDKATYVLSLLDLSGERVWQYEGAPTRVAKDGEPTERTVTAFVDLLGKRFTAELKVDVSPAESSVLSGSATYGGKYNVNNRTFTFDIYNDTAPQTVLDSFEYLTVKADTEYVKKVKWDLSSFAIAPFYAKKESDRVRDYKVRPLVETYFGKMIDLGEVDSVAAFTIHVNGYPAVYLNYEKTFEAYDGMDFTDEMVYSDVLAVYHYLPGKENESDLNKSIDFANPVMVDGVTWILDVLTQLKADKNGEMYKHSGTTKVNVKIYDFTGYSTQLPVNVRFVPHEVGTVSFDSLPDGVTFDEEKQKFTFDVLKVRELSAAAIDKVLPLSLVANKGKTTAFEVKGLKWEFDPVKSDALLNSSGKTGTITLVIGDDISGYQYKQFPYEFTSVAITGTALLAEDGTTVIAQKAASDAEDVDLFSYELTGLGAYTYRYPTYLRATYKVGEGSNEREESEVLAANWKSETSYSEEDLWTGGTYLLTSALGSEEVTLSLTFKQQKYKGYRFGTDEEKCVVSEADDRRIPLTMHEGKLCLTYSVLDALADASEAVTTPLNYKKAADYPAEIELTFDGSTYVKAPVVWDLSAYEQKDMIGVGGIVTVTAKAKGQVIQVFVYVERAVGKGDKVYVNEEEEEILTFRLMNPEDGGFVVTDPRDVANYPKVLYITSSLTSTQHTVNVLSYAGIDKVTRLFNSAKEEGKAPNEVKGEVEITARIGSDAVGFTDLPIRVSIVDSQVSKVTLSGVPFAAGSDQTSGATLCAVTVHEEAGTDPFAYDLSIDLNPYYVDPLSAASYPAYVNFTLEGKAVRAKAAWDLTSLVADEKNLRTYEKTVTYRVYAMVDLTDAFSNLSIPVAVNVLKRDIVNVWIKDIKGVYSAERYLDIDGYAAEPFGKDVVGDEVTLDVKVQFKGDANKYPLKLKYSKEGVMLYYDGRSLYENVTVRVGNENGGYQKVEGYCIRVLSNIVSKIELKSEWCSELYERHISGYNGTGVNIKYDDCNPFGMIAGDFGEIASLSKHTTKTASDSTIVAFNSLSELFAAFMANFEIPTDGTEYIPSIGSDALDAYTLFYNAAIELYNGSHVSFTKNVSNDLTGSAVIGVNHPYTMAFGTDVSPELINFQTVIANLFGFSSVSDFMDYAQDLADTYAAHRTNIANSTAVNEALENGCFYTTNDSFVFPIAVKNKLSSTVLAYVILDASGFVSVWVNDITAALWATNFNASYHTDTIIDNELYCKNILFVTGPESGKLPDTDGVFFEAKEESDKLVYSYQQVVNMANPLPDTLKVVFGLDGESQPVYRYKSETAPSAGVVFDWSRNEDGELGVVLWNPALDGTVNDDGSLFNPTKQSIYNPKQTNYCEITQSFKDKFFDDMAAWEHDYRDSADGGYITVNTILELHRNDILKDEVEAEYQEYFVVKEAVAIEKEATLKGVTEEDAVGVNDRLNAGTYRLYVNVVGHSYYQGKVYEKFTIKPKNIAGDILFYVGAGQYPDGSFETAYTGKAFVVTAKLKEEYPVTVDLLVGLKESEAPIEYLDSISITDVKYVPETSDVTYYEFVAKVATDGNYVVEGAETFRFTLKDAGFTAEERAKVVVSKMTWEDGEFDFSVYYGEQRLEEDDKLVNGYKISFYNDKDDAEPVTALVEGKEYFYRIEIKLPNKIKLTDDKKPFAGNVQAYN